MPERDTVGQGRGVGGSIAWRSPTVVGIVASAIVTPMAVPLISPALPAVRAALGITDAQAGLLITVYALPAIVLAPLAGMLADRVGRRQLLAGCLVGYGVAGSAIAATSDFSLVLFLRFVQGCTAGSIIFSLAVTLVGDHFDGAERNTVMGVTTAGLSLGVAVYPAVGGYLSSIRWNLPFALYGISALVGLFVFLTLREPDIERGPMGLSYVRDVYSAVPTGEMAGLYGLVVAREVILFGAIFTGIPFLLEGTFGLDPTGIGLLTSGMLAVTAVVSALNGWFARRFADRYLVAAGFCGYALGLAVIGLAGRSSVALLALAVVGAGHGLGSPSLFTSLTDLTAARFRGGVVSVRATITAVGQALGPALFTAAAPIVGYDGLMTVTGVTAALVGAVAVPVLRPGGASKR